MHELRNNSKSKIQDIELDAVGSNLYGWTLAPPLCCCYSRTVVVNKAKAYNRPDSVTAFRRGPAYW